MSELVDDIVSSDTIKTYEETYNREVEEGNVTTSSTFDYACSLVRSRYAADIYKGLRLLEQLYTNGTENVTKSFIFFLAIGHTKVKEYKLALKYVRELLKMDPSNVLVQRLESLIATRKRRAGLKEVAVAGNCVLILGGLLSVGLALLKR